VTTAAAAVTGVVPNSEYLTVAEVAEILRVRPDLVRKLCQSKQLAATKLGGRQGWRIHKDALDAFMRVGQTQPTRPNRTRRAAK
jgi:excisionase family DNA binding protein